MVRGRVTRRFRVTTPRELRKIGAKMGGEMLVKEEGKRIVFGKATSIENPGGAWTQMEDTEDFMREVRKLRRTWKPPSWTPRS